METALQTEFKPRPPNSPRQWQPTVSPSHVRPIRFKAVTPVNLLGKHYSTTVLSLKAK